MKNNIKTFIISVLIPLLTGGLAGLLTSKSMVIYKHLNLPPLSPPGFIFPIVWTILYILMGIGAYFIIISNSSTRTEALRTYALQLVLNFLWTIVFFNMRNFLLAFMILIALWALIIKMIITFKNIKPIAGYLQIPYLLWVTFAGYLNFMVFILN
ncbi:TspO/MBR family protein [Anaerofustis stercorihominis]|uniref:Tryptophan-rich sensory protein n=1 Tax=Anaerofustis stercorihominis TaxID=214853 RepID=A0A3E3DZ34_9FIRM|nr:TspO/MBR family protein [Anaerofustis stercorihominis]MCQ4794182.1 tryptophan-rich sensory protein [Anaerofustis stercorihominis]RGD74561.1 tryptophan-rich sensory protein [Anaerofustis stercorihominis]